MLDRDFRDIVTGLVLLLGGLGFSLHAGLNYRLGSVLNMGPGMFPMALGIILAFLGGLIGIQALGRKGNLPTVAVRPALAILASLAVFATTVEAFGLVVAIVLLTVVAALADDKLGLRTSIALAAALSLAAVVIFRWGLGIQIPVARWPF